MVEERTCRWNYPLGIQSCHLLLCSMGVIKQHFGALFPFSSPPTIHCQAATVTSTQTPLSHEMKDRVVNTKSRKPVLSTPLDNKPMPRCHMTAHWINDSAPPPARGLHCSTSQAPVAIGSAMDRSLLCRDPGWPICDVAEVSPSFDRRDRLHQACLSSL